MQVGDELSGEMDRLHYGSDGWRRPANNLKLPWKTAYKNQHRVFLLFTMTVSAVKEVLPNPKLAGKKHLRGESESD